MFCPKCGVPVIVTSGGVAKTNEVGRTDLGPGPRSRSFLWLLLLLLLLAGGGWGIYAISRNKPADQHPAAPQSEDANALAAKVHKMTPGQEAKGPPASKPPRQDPPKAVPPKQDPPVPETPGEDPPKSEPALRHRHPRSRRRAMT